MNQTLLGGNKNWKAVVIGAIAFWLVTNILGMAVTGFFIHNKVLDPIYRANAHFWLPELAQEEPDMAALMPKWLLNSFLASLVVAGIYVCVHGSFEGGGARKGMMWGLCLGFIAASTYMAMSGVFNLPSKMWMGWAAERFGGLTAQTG